MSASPQQKLVMKGAFAAICTATLAAYLVVTLPPWSATKAIPLPFIWAYAMLGVSIWLPILIAVRGNQRYANPNQIEGAPPPAGSVHEIDARVLQNTLEQTVFATIATGLLTLSQAHHTAMLLLLHALLFSLGRAFFWWGYRRQPVLRAYGFALTFYSTLGIFLYAASFFLRALEI